MNGEKSSLGLTIGIIVTITGAIWSIGRIYPLLTEGSSVSQLEFYMIIGIIAIILYFGVELFRMRRDFAKEKNFIREELKTIKEHMEQSEERLDSIKNDINQTLGRIESSNEKHSERTNSRIDELLLAFKS